MRRIVRLKRVCLLLLVALVGGAAWLYYSYGGFTRASLNYLRHATYAENRNLYYYLDYWFEMVGTLRRDETGFYSFDGVDESGLDGFVRGRLAYHRGDFAQAIEHFERDIATRGESEQKLFWLAMSSMRLAEAENCLAELTAAAPAAASAAEPHGPRFAGEHASMCVLPLMRYHERPSGARKAAALFERLLDDYDSGNRLYQWLLNFNLMTAGGYPSGVPERYRIVGDFVESFYGRKRSEREAEFPDLSFAERAKELGVDTLNAGRGVAVEDFDGDGHLDVVAGGSYDQLKFYRADRGTRFEDRTEEFGLGGVRQSLFVTAADYDNDGWVDLLVAHVFGEHTRLFRNDGGRGFTDVTASSGINDGVLEGQRSAVWATAWADVDNDGDLDLFLAGMGVKIPLSKGILAQPRADSRLLVNEGNHFVDRTAEFGLSAVVRDHFFVGAAFGDSDADGDADLFLSSPFPGASVLLKNISGKGFAAAGGYGRVEGGFAAGFVDVNHDGRLDIFQAGVADARTSVEQTVFGEGKGIYRSGHSTVLVQGADGSFTASDEMFDMPMGTMGSSYGDINNDGCHDFYLGTGTPEGWFVLPNLMYLGRARDGACAEELTNVSMLGGFGTIQKGHAVVFFDFDGDGDQDIYSSLGGMWPADRWPNQLFVNESPLAHAWVKARLRGRRTNRFGVGATLRVVAENASGEEVVRYAQVDQKTGFGSAPYLAHVGLLDAVRIREVQVYWPGSRLTKSYAARLRELNVLDEEEGLVVREGRGGAP